MAIRAIIFSRDRAAQLDLLLSSLELNAPGMLDPVEVLWCASDEPFERAYGLCADAHPAARFVRETAFAEQVEALIEPPGPVTFFTDDSVLVRSLAERSRLPQGWLATDDDLICFSLRLGRNCDTCYPLARSQQLPELEELGEEAVTWTWRGADGDFGYPGSLDGHVFRSETLRELVGGRDYTNPNTLEGLLAVRIAEDSRSRMASYRESHLVGVPVNRVNETHPNRFGERWPHGPDVLNEAFLAGRRLDPEPLLRETVRGAHEELPLRWRASAR